MSSDMLPPGDAHGSLRILSSLRSDANRRRYNLYQDYTMNLRKVKGSFLLPSKCVDRIQSGSSSSRHISEERSDSHGHIEGKTTAPGVGVALRPARLPTAASATAAVNAVIPIRQIGRASCRERV